MAFWHIEFDVLLMLFDISFYFSKVELLSCFLCSSVLRLRRVLLYVVNTRSGQFCLASVNVCAIFMCQCICYLYVPMYMLCTV